MKELAKRFIDKECVISSFDGNHQYEGVIKEVTDGAILLEKNGKIEALNLDFVIRIREYPRKKNGKKKTVILDWIYLTNLTDRRGGDNRALFQI